MHEADVKTVDIIYRYRGRDSTARPLPPDSDAALLRLEDGNKAFAALLDRVMHEGGLIQHIITVDPCDLDLEQDSTGPAKHRPFAAILGCSDARVPVEHFNEGPNDLL
jgi:carbonic anhydrase